jgi:hypothetical protein
MNIDPSVLYKLVWGIGIMATVLAAGVSALFQLLNGWRERLAADRRHLQDLALKAAVVQWEHDVAENLKARSVIGTYPDPRPEPLSERDFDRILLRKLKLIESFGKRAAKPKDQNRA